MSVKISRHIFKKYSSSALCTADWYFRMTMTILLYAEKKKKVQINLIMSIKWVKQSTELSTSSKFDCMAALNNCRPADGTSHYILYF